MRSTFGHVFINGAVDLLTVMNGPPLGAAATLQNQKPKEMGQNCGLFCPTGDAASSTWGRSGEEAWPRI